MLTNSEEFDDAVWTKSNTTISANQIIAPDGTLTADKLVEDATSNTHRIFAIISEAAGTYTATIYAKYSGRDFISIRMFTTAGSNFATAVFNVNTGVIGATASSGGYTSLVSTITSVGNGWYRCSLKATASGAVANFLMGLLDSDTANADGGTTYTGDGYSGIYIWGAQLEAGAFASPYIPTVASQVTRVADSAVMTGVNFSSWFNPSEGTLFADYTSSRESRYVFSIRNANFVADRVLLWTNGALTTPDGSISSTNLNAKRAISYQVGSLKMATNGTLNTEDTSVTNGWSDAASVIFGASNLAASSSNMNGYFKRLTYYPQALTSANLQAITR
jgi:hypothetical protein